MFHDSTLPIGRFRFVEGILKGIYVVRTLLHVTLAGTVSGRQRQRIEVRSQGFFPE